MSNLQPNYCLKFDFQKVDQHAGGKWLIHDTKRRKDNQLQSLKLPCRISKLSSKMLGCLHVSTWQNVITKCPMISEQDNTQQTYGVVHNVLWKQFEVMTKLKTITFPVYSPVVTGLLQHT